MVLNLRKERVKKIALAYLAIILVPLNLNADIIFFKDGMKTVCEDRAWAEGAEVKCEYQGLVLTYQKNDVLRIEKIEPEKSSPKNEASSKTASGPAGQPPGTKQPSSLKKAVLKKKLQSPANNAGSLKATGLEFYNPRRPYKYWTGKNAKYNTFKEAVAALSAQYERSPEWIQHHMGTTNSIDEIHRNLRNREQNAPVKIQAGDNETMTREDPVSTGRVQPQNITPFKRPLPYWPKSTSVLLRGSNNISEIRITLMRFIKIWQTIN
jgi:hypothetical protein